MTNPIECFTGGLLGTNAYLIQDEENLIVIDAPPQTADYLTGHGMKPTHLLITHQHFDHVEDVKRISEMGAKVYSFAEARNTDEMAASAARWGIPVSIAQYQFDQLVKEGEKITIGDLDFEIDHVPGHSEDSITFYCAKLKALFAGDTLFEQSIGRTDLPGGNHQLLLDGIRKKLFSKPSSTLVFPGHGGSSTIEAEQNTNPYLQK